MSATLYRLAIIALFVGGLAGAYAWLGDYDDKRGHR